MNPEQRRIFALFPRSGKTGLDGSPPPSGDITFPLRITNAGGDGSAEACCEQRVDLLEVRTGGATAIRNFDGRNVALHARCPNRTAAMPIVSRTSEIGCRVPRTHFLRHERAQRLSRVSARRIAKPLLEPAREMRIVAKAASIGDLAERLAGAR